MLFPYFRDYCGNQLLICGVTQPVLNNLSLANDSIPFSFLCHRTRYAVAVAGGGGDFGVTLGWLIRG